MSKEHVDHVDGELEEKTVHCPFERFFLLYLRPGFLIEPIDN